MLSDDTDYGAFISFSLFLLLTSDMDSNVSCVGIHE
jgi:hypothetical protein